MDGVIKVDENPKLRREIIFKVLGWGTIVYFLVLGYSMDPSGLFELRIPQQAVDLQRAKLDEAAQLEKTLDQIPIPDSSKPAAEDKKVETVEETKAKVAETKAKVAKLRLEAHRLEEEWRDGWSRAVGLIAGTALYAVIFPVVVFFAYKKVYPEAAKTDLIPMRIAIPCAVIMSALTLGIALLVACR